MIGRLNHVAIVVPDLEAAAAKYRVMFGAEVSEPQNLPEHTVTVVFVTLGNTRIELLHPLGNNSVIAKFLEKAPLGGIHHICFEVPDIDAATQRLVKEGAKILGDGSAKTGAHGRPVIFLDPKGFDGTLIELEEVG